jgi:putative intracellular protease/amidase
MAEPATVGAWYRGLRLVAVDGTTFDVPDTASNLQAFGRPGSGRGERSAFPQVRVVAVAECGTHAVFAAATGPLSAHETTLARELFASLSAGMLLLADRGFVGFDLWRLAAANGADLLWRVKSNMVLPVLEQLTDGSYLSQIVAARDRKRVDPITVRVIEYTLTDPTTVYRLITTLTDPAAAPATELAAAYAQRWEFETALDEFKTHQRGPRVVLRSKMPDGVRQEIWGYLCVHHAIRWLMHTVAIEADTDPDRLSFTRTLRAARRSTTSHPGFRPPRP